jgi:ATP-dependent Clp protease ATP-binding subunit ClpB
LKQTIRPEFLNRIDEIIMFAPLMEDQVKQIVILQFEKIQQMMLESGIRLKITGNGIQWLANHGFDPQFGARPIKRLMQKYILNELSKQILSGVIDKSEEIKIDCVNNQLIFNK